MCLSLGNHQKIDEYRREERIKETLKKRPDMLKNNEINIKEGNL